MRYSIIFTTTTLAAGASAHGVIRNIYGDNGVSMPGLNIADGTPRNCASNACGAQADTAIIRNAEIQAGRSPMGWTGGHGDVDAESVVNAYMGRSAAPTNNGASGATGQEDNVGGALGGVLGGLFGGGGGNKKSKSSGGGGGGFLGGLFGRGEEETHVERRNEELHKRRYEEHMNEMRDLFSTFANLPVIGVLGIGGKINDYPEETLIADSYGMGAQKGFPTADANGVVKAVYRQINQDGAGPLTAAIDPTSGGKDQSAFQAAQMVKDVPGSGISGLSIATNTDYDIGVQMPQGMVCQGEIAGVKNLCVLRVRNQALAGPFGGCGVFQQNEQSRKRAIEYLNKRALEANETSVTESE